MQHFNKHQQATHTSHVGHTLITAAAINWPQKSHYTSARHIIGAEKTVLAKKFSLFF